MATYQEWLTKDGLNQIESWARDGLTNEQIAKNCGVRRQTFQKWIKDHSDIYDALKKGKAPVDFEVENTLLKRAMGFEYEETETLIEEVDGKKKKKIRRMQKYALPDTSAMIFWLKNRRPEQWRRLSPEVKAKIEAETSKLKNETRLLQHEADKLEQSGEVNELLKALIDVSTNAGDDNDD